MTRRWSDVADMTNDELADYLLEEVTDTIGRDESGRSTGSAAEHAAYNRDRDAVAAAAQRLRKIA